MRTENKNNNKSKRIKYHEKQKIKREMKEESQYSVDRYFRKKIQQNKTKKILQKMITGTDGM